MQGDFGVAPSQIHRHLARECNIRGAPDHVGSVQRMMVRSGFHHFRSDIIKGRQSDASRSSGCWRVCDYTALKELRNGAKRDFRSKTLGTPRLIPAINDDGQIAWITRSLSSAALSGSHTKFKTQGSASLHPGLLRLRHAPQLVLTGSAARRFVVII